MTIFNHARIIAGIEKSRGSKNESWKLKFFDFSYWPTLWGYFKTLGAKSTAQHNSYEFWKHSIETIILEASQ